MASDLNRAEAEAWTGGAVAQLPVVIPTPGPQGAVGLDGQRVVGAAVTAAQSVAVPIWTAPLLVAVPSPSCPTSLAPQAHKVPSVFIATVCWPPAATDAKLVSLPTWIGREV